MPAADVSRFAADVRRFADRAPGDVIDVVDAAITRRLLADTGGDGALSRGRKLGRATTSVTRRSGEATVEPSGSRAVWGILQGGTSAHVITAAPGSFLATPKGPRRQVRIPATRARLTFTEGAQVGLDAAERDMARRWAEV